ncbi:NADH-quinone oxidoreductase subunit NuoN [Aeromicrobium wangtongii]|uniref:NADH-quinone oxidoreductase subunit N n=1 Tax=Aeromicrobium wangtongii TaxID=2969247 RepID=A0ABY5M844_9ACTN|nr:NADH-quinone oxidoreductase subunit NuoN [Aeromicrobium wangtongii]MCD9200021.1 NADH-quinone oxidoreductase subunit NuoN [Aeromicrobium wangtongii]UUP13281.1 NADH-quinone oxidoreductase subunit NuoN [Aeromicrobium wangtongii]
MITSLLSADLPPIAAPEIQYSLLGPLFIIAGAAVLGVVVEAFWPRGSRFVVQTGLAVVAIVAAIVDTVLVYNDLDRIEAALQARGQVAAEGALSIDGPGVFAWGSLLVFGLLSMMLFAERRLEGGMSAFTGRAADAPGSAAEAEAVKLRVEHSEIFPLALFALVGMMLFATANDLLTMFVALEVLSLPLYLLCGLARRRRLLSQEAALKYFLLGAFSSVFFLYGIALAYGYSGSFDLAAIDRAVTNRTGGENMLLAATALIAVGLLFKIGAAPFHTWTPDVYQGAPTPVTAFMAAGTKAAAFLALLRVFFVAFGGSSWDWRPMIVAIAIITMFLGAVVSISQTDVKRMLAYSSIAHAGFLLVGFVGVYAGVAGSDRITSVSSVLFYLAVYGLSSIGAFAVVTLVRDSGGETTHLSKWAGLGRTSPWLAGSFAVFMLSFAGIPLTGGFIGKWGVFSAAYSGGFWWLVVIGVLISALAAYFYVRVIVLMFFTDPVGDGPTVAVPSALTTVVIVVAVLGTVGLGIIPGPVLDLAQHAGAFVR